MPFRDPPSHLPARPASPSPSQDTRLPRIRRAVGGSQVALPVQGAKPAQPTPPAQTAPPAQKEKEETSQAAQPVQPAQPPPSAQPRSDTPPPPTVPPTTLPANLTLSYLVAEARARRLLFRIHTPSSTSPLLWTGDMGTSGFSSPNAHLASLTPQSFGPLFSQLSRAGRPIPDASLALGAGTGITPHSPPFHPSPYLRHALIDHILLKHRQTCIMQLHTITENLEGVWDDEKTPWVSASEDPFWVVWEVARRLCAPSRPGEQGGEREVEVAVIKHPESIPAPSEEGGSWAVSPHPPQLWLRPAPVLVPKYHFGDMSFSQKDLYEAANKAAETCKEVCFYGRVWCENVLGNLVWTRTSTPFELPMHLFHPPSPPGAHPNPYPNPNPNPNPPTAIKSSSSHATPATPAQPLPSIRSHSHHPRASLPAHPTPQSAYVYSQSVPSAQRPRSNRSGQGDGPTAGGKEEKGGWVDWLVWSPWEDEYMTARQKVLARRRELEGFAQGGGGGSVSKGDRGGESDADDEADEAEGGGTARAWGKFRRMRERVSGPWPTEPL